MADRHSSRHGRPRSTAGTGGSRSPPKSPQLPTGNSILVPVLPSGPETQRELVNELKSVAWRLTAAYCTSITVQAALEGQMADRDEEFARCLRTGVSDPVSRQVDRLQALVARFGGRPSRAPLE